MIYIITGMLFAFTGLVTLMIVIRRREDEKFKLWMRDFEFSLGHTVGQFDEENICREMFQSNLDFKTAVEYYLLIKDAEKQ